MNELYERLADAVVQMDDAQAAELAHQIVREGLPIADAIEQGLIAGMERVGVLYEQEEYFLTEVLMCADAMDAAFAILAPHLAPDASACLGRVVIGTVQGDTHDIGKNIVALMLRGAGFAVLDLGKDVSPERFVTEALSFHADIIAMSTLMTTTMENMRPVIALLEDNGVRDQFRVIIGGKPCSPAFARRIGADGYSSNAAGAVRLCRRLMEERIAPPSDESSASLSK